MPVISASIDTFLATGAAVTAGTYFILKRTQAKSRSPYRDVLNIFVILHTVYIVYVITVRTPPNLFKTLGLPLNTPSDSIRSRILDSAGPEANVTLPKPLETLLTRLSSFDGRSIYIRFGQSVIQNCEHCRTQDQYALFALPGPLLQYIREAAVIGLITTVNSHRSFWRPLGITALVAMGLLEAYYLTSAPITIPRDGRVSFFWADNFWFARQAVFLVLPIVIHSLPSSVPISSLQAMIKTTGMAETVWRRAALLKYLRGAIMRDPALRASSTQWWEMQKVVGQWAREDDVVKLTAEKFGSGYSEEVGAAQIVPKIRATVEAMLARADPNAPVPSL